MKSLLSWLLTFFIIMFWIFRIVVVITVQFGAEDYSGFIVFDRTFEIAMLFITLLCLILNVKRKILGGLIYLGGYGWYFGNYFVSTILPLLKHNQPIEQNMILNLAAGVLAIILGLAAVLDILFEKNQAKHYSDDRTDWYFKTDKYDRKYDERADKNQYRTL